MLLFIRWESLVAIYYSNIVVHFLEIQLKKTFTDKISNRQY